MDKKKKGFTLIELLAIIVILAIIAVITVPIILNIIEESKKGAAKDSADEHSQTVSPYYTQQLLNNQNLKLNDTYTVTNGTLSGGSFGDSNVTSFPVQVSGTVPSSGSLTYSNNNLTEGCLVIGEYAVTFSGENVTNTTKGECILKAKIYRTINNELVKIDKSEMQSGDTVLLKSGDIEETFIVISDSTHIDSKAPAGTTTLLAVNNLNVGPNKDTSLPEGYQGIDHSHYKVKFSETNYWMDTTTNPNTLKSNYTNNNTYSYDSTTKRFVDTNNTIVYPYIYDSSITGSSGTNYSVAYYVNMYVMNLKELGFTGVNSGRILTNEEVAAGGIAASYKISGEYYWLGSVYKSSLVIELEPIYGYINAIDYSSQWDAGVRPVIYINTSDIQ